MTLLEDPAVQVPNSAENAAAARSSGSGVGWWAIAMAIALLALVTAVIGLSLPADNGEGGASGPTTTEFEITLIDLDVQPASIDVPAGKAITLMVKNEGAVAHDLKLNGTVGTVMLEPGKSETIVLPAMSASGQAWCTVPGHQSAGMVLDINVAGSGNGTDGGATAPTTPASNNAVIDFDAAPAAGWVPFDPTLQPAPGGTEHTLTMNATEKVIEVSPGVTQQMWTFNDQVPGPTLRGRVGDLLTITLVNQGQLGHSIDFHASKVAWNDEMRTIKPGESLVYQFTAQFAGIFMYHCGTAPALHHIGNGMFGAVIIDPPVLAPVDHEFVLVQSEIYTGPQGQPGDLTKMINEEWDAVVFNSYVKQYLHAPIRVEPNERVRVWVLDAGPSENSAFHIVGTIFDTVFKEGDYLLQPSDAKGGSQVLDLQPAQGGFVEFTFDEAGLYPIVTHKFANVGKGALGLFQAGEVVAAGGAGH